MSNTAYVVLLSLIVLTACGDSHRKAARSAVSPSAAASAESAGATREPAGEVEAEEPSVGEATSEHETTEHETTEQQIAPKPAAERSPTSSPAAPPSTPDFLSHPNNRALWVWNEQPTTRQLLENTDGARDTLLAFAEAPHGQPHRQITRLFFETRQKTTPDPWSTLHTITYDPLTDPAARPKLQDFVAEARARGVEVEHLAGQAIWLASDAQAEVPKQICADIVAYNEASAPDQRLAGVHLDIEPHTVRSGPWAGVWWEDRLPGGYNAQWTRRWTEILDACRATLDAYEARSGHAMTLSADLGADYAFYNAPLRAHLDRADGPVDYLTLMNYFDNRANLAGQPSFFHGDSDGSNVVGGVEQNLGLWTQVPLLFGVETGPAQIAEDRQSFYQEGYDALHSVADQLVAGYGGQPRVLGIAIHHYGPHAYASMQP